MSINSSFTDFCFQLSKCYTILCDWKIDHRTFWSSMYCSVDSLYYQLMLHLQVCNLNLCFLQGLDLQVSLALLFFFTNPYDSCNPYRHSIVTYWLDSLHWFVLILSSQLYSLTTFLIMTSFLLHFIMQLSCFPHLYLHTFWFYLVHHDFKWFLLDQRECSKI